MISNWFRRWHKVTLASKHIQIITFREGHGYELHKSPELSVWLHENPCKYRLRCNQLTGARWIEFTDKSIAAICKLTMTT